MLTSTQQHHLGCWYLSDDARLTSHVSRLTSHVAPIPSSQQAEAVSIPVIANGGSLDIKEHKDLASFQARTGCQSVMLARAAQWNMSVFRPEGLVPTEDVVRAYLRLVSELKIQKCLS